MEIKKETDLTDYSKEQQYYHKKNLYNSLRPKLNTAISNAQFLEYDRDAVSPYYPRTEIFKLIQDLLKI